LVCFELPAESKNADKPTSQDLVKACLKKELFLTGELADRCIVAKINVIPQNYVDAYPVIT